VYRALGGGWEIREGKDFVPEATLQEMRTRTNWGNLIPPQGLPPEPMPEPTPAGQQPILQPVEW